jgi:hypothetical protein
VLSIAIQGLRGDIRDSKATAKASAAMGVNVSSRVAATVNFAATLRAGGP